MAATHRSAFKARARTDIPRFALYDEPVRSSAAGLLHVETIASRSRERDWTIHAHAHRDLHQLLLIEDGAGEMRAEDARLAFGPSSLLAVPAGVVHGFAFRPGTAGWIVTIGDALLRPLLGEPPVAALWQSARLIAMDAHGPALLGPVARLVEETHRAAPLARIAAEAALRLLLIEAARTFAAGGASGQADLRRAAALVARFRAQIEQRLGEGWSIARHAAALGISPSRLRAACDEAAGAAPIVLLRDRMMIEARRMLTHGGGDVASIGYALGFADPAYFSRWFARAEGCPPGAYRRARSPGG